MSMTDDEILAEGCRVFNLERQALEKVENRFGSPVCRGSAPPTAISA